jgi:hypothetical protein
MISLLRYSLLLLSFFACTIAESQTILQGDIVQYIRVVRGWIPGQGTNAFVIPSDQEISACKKVFLDLQSKNYSNIQTDVAQFGYSFYKFVDQASTDTLLILVENQPVQRGWGTLIFNPWSDNSMMIEIPHPIWDTNTWEVGIRAFIALNAQWFMMAGTHRYANADSSSDMAHVTQSIFHTVHINIATDRAMQIHGFSKSSYAGYPDVVMSNGTKYPPAEIFTMQTSYQRKGFSVGVYSLATSSSLGKLGATTNAQGQWSNRNGKIFIHIEHDYPLRNEPVKIAQVVQAIKETDFSAKSSTFRLEQNYPNPFNLGTTIEFNVTKTTSVSLDVIGLNGGKIATLFRGELGPGDHAIPFIADNLASGIYFYTVKSPEWTKTKKMLLIK